MTSAPGVGQATPAGLRLPDGETERMARCAQEPITRPGAIQPHGALLVVEIRRLLIIAASENTEQVLGVAAPALTGTGLGRLIGPAAQRRVRAILDATPGETNPVNVLIAGQRFDAIVHRVGEADEADRAVGIVEFEMLAAETPARDFTPELHAALARVARAADVTELRQLAAQEMRQLTGYDQVMVYHFWPDGHGEVVADEQTSEMTSHLGLHFPASDIPIQARALYLAKASGSIATTDYRPATLIPADVAPIDLTQASLRSVSPSHLQFMRNMGQRASLTLPLALDGQLLGMIACAHHEPRRTPFLLRLSAEILARQITLQLGAMARSRELTHRIEAHDIRNLLVEQMRSEPDVASALVEGDVTVLNLVHADGATVCREQQLRSIGHTPTYAQTTALIAALSGSTGAVTPLVSEALLVDRPELAALAPTVAGVLGLPFGGAGDCLLWFRREISQAMDWLGDQSAANRLTPLSPRTSFDQWRQTVTDHSLAWDEMEIAEAAELGRDVDQILLRRAEDELVHLGTHDGLTGLPNRNLLLDRIRSAVTRAARCGDEAAILFCDLDDFKAVNDSAGHAAGDAVLIEAAARLKSTLRATDSVARVGGDEFVIVLEADSARELTGPTGSGSQDDGEEPIGTPETLTTREFAAAVCLRIQAELTRPFVFQGQEHIISVSTGITFATAGSQAEELLRDADAAMYRAKQSGKNRLAVFDDSIRDRMVNRSVAEHALRSALDQSGPRHTRPDQARLSTVYQPIIDLDHRQVVAFEALARVTDSDGRSISPELFISVAEQTGLITALGETVLEDALSALVQWRAEHGIDGRAVPGKALHERPGARVTIGVNFSARQAHQADLPKRVRAALHRHGLQPRDLTLELTETVLMEAGSSTLRQLTELHDDGVGIAIDDFGTGFASLRYLMILPVDAVKIDQSFTAGLPEDATSMTIVHSVARMAADLGLTCIVEGIETEAQLAALPAGVLGQGYLLGRPSSVPHFDV